MALVAHFDLKLCQIDVKTSFFQLAYIQSGVHGATRWFSVNEKGTYGMQA
jgi:hypothetical protein